MSSLKAAVHVQQMALGYCLPACAQMALAQLGIVVPQARLAQTLGTRVGVGTPFSRVERLVQWNVRVRLMQGTAIGDLVASLTADMAVIVAVTTTPHSGTPPRTAGHRAGVTWLGQHSHTTYATGGGCRR